MITAAAAAFFPGRLPAVLANGPCRLLGASLSNNRKEFIRESVSASSIVGSEAHVGFAGNGSKNQGSKAGLCWRLGGLS
jgi:hypothetical protein